jgi:hypothetical protein
MVHKSLSRSLTKFSSLFSIAVLLAVSLLAQKTTTTYIPVTTTIHNDNAAPNDLLFRSDGASEASYQDGGSVHSISSHLAPTGAWQLYIGNQTARRVWLTLSHSLPGSPSAPAPDGYYSDSVEVYSRCWDINNTVVPFLAIPAGTSINRCDFGLDFAYKRVGYKLVMGPSIPTLGLDTSGTGWATVSCNSATGGACNSWTIVPNMIAGGGNVPTVANLYQFTKNGNPLLIGQYYNTYRVDVTNP